MLSDRVIRDYDQFEGIDPEVLLFLDECERDQEHADRDRDALEAELYARLEKPRKRRQAPLVSWHHKRWGHGNSREMINRVGQFNLHRERLACA